MVFAPSLAAIHVNMTLTIEAYTRQPVYQELLSRHVDAGRSCTTEGSSSDDETTPVSMKPMVGLFWIVWGGLGLSVLSACAVRLTLHFWRKGNLSRGGVSEVIDPPRQQSSKYELKSIVELDAHDDEHAAFV
jgi:hypothetical protein